MEGERFLVLAELLVSRRFPFGITIHHTREIPFMSILQNAAAAEEGELYGFFSPTSLLLRTPSPDNVVQVTLTDKITMK